MLVRNFPAEGSKPVRTVNAGGEVPERTASQFSVWKWKYAAQIAKAFERRSPNEAARFLSRISQTVDDRARCLAAAREALDVSASEEGADWIATVGNILVQQDPALFLKRLRGFAARMRGLEFVLYRWAALASPNTEAAARVRSLIASLPMHRRDHDWEVTLAVIDGDAALARRDATALRESLQRIERYVPGSEFHLEQVLEFLRRAVRQRGAKRLVDPALRALLPTKVGAQAAAMLSRRSRR